jgi:MoxR-like ATPase
MTSLALADRTARVLDVLGQAVIGKPDVLRMLLAAVLANGHVLLEDVPGVAKTTLARALGTVLGLGFRRVQFTPDLLPADLTGSFIYDQSAGRFVFRHGPIFTRLLLADEINRASPKTQSALLEAMQERQVTVEGETFPLEQPFLVIATQNPIEQEGTYALPEAELDRFLVRLALGYPSEADELRILQARRERRRPEVSLPTLLGPEAVLAMQAAVEDVFLEPSVERYIVSLIRATRTDPRIALGGSPRAALGLMQMSRALAALEGRTFVTPDDVKRVAVPALAHRLVLQPEHWGGRLTTRKVIDTVLERTPVPVAEAR